MTCHQLSPPLSGRSPAECPPEVRSMFASRSFPLRSTAGRRFGAAVAAALLLAGLLPASAAPVLASHTPTPASVTVAGNLQSELGCPGDWQPDCATTHLTHEAADGIWQGSFVVPAGDWEYKAPLNDGWDENYGLHAQAGGANIPLSLAAEQSVKFYYDHATHWITDNVDSVIVTAAGSFQSELG